MRGRPAIDLLAQLADEDVDGRSRWPSRRPHSFCSSSSRLTTRPRSSASAYRTRNSVGVSPALSPSTYACTCLGSMRSSSISIVSPSSLRSARVLAAKRPGRGDEPFIEKGLTR